MTIKSIKEILMISATIFYSCTSDIKEIDQLEKSFKKHRESTHLFLTGVDGRSTVLNVHTSDTIGTIKSIIQDQTGISPKAQRISYGKTQFTNDDLSLSEYGILQDSFLQLSLNINGGMIRALKLTKDEQPKESELSSEGPKWLVVKPGLNIAFECENSSCPSHKDEYYNWSPQGVGEMTISTQIFKGRVVCVACGRVNRTDKCLRGYCFRECSYLIQGTYYDDKDFQKNNNYKKTTANIKAEASGSTLKNYLKEDWVWWTSLVITTS